MNDSELITEVKDSFAGVQASTPVEDIVRRGRAVRARRRIPVVAAVATGAAAVAALSVTALLPASQHSGAQPAVRLAAWTVARQADGMINVDISQLSDMGGLQGTLRGDGVPVSVTAWGQPNPACQLYTPVTGVAASGVVRGLGRPNFLAIDPAALPSGAGLQIGVQHNKRWVVSVYVVQATPECTGS